MHTSLLTAVVLILITPAPLLGGDALDDALGLVGMQRQDLGWRAKGWWPRWPDVPYKLRAFDALFAEPLDTIAYTRALGQTAYDLLDPEQLAKEDTDRNSRALFQAVQRLGIDPKFGGFRGYTANTLAPEMPLDQAIVALYRAAGRTTQPNTFGMALPYPKIEEQIAEQAKNVPEEISPILGQLVLNIIEARRWVDLAFRKVDAADRLAVATRYDVGMEMIDAYDYCPAIDDVAKTWDEASMWYAAQKCVDALDLARIKLQMWKSELDGPVPDFAFDWETPWGWIRVRGVVPPRNPSSSGIHFKNLDGTDSCLVVELGDDTTYAGPVAAGSPSTPISLLLDLGGTDNYRSAPGAIGEYQSGLAPSQGAGLCGVGILIDAGGNDRYGALRYGQGVGQFGFGLLADLAGDDEYCLQHSGQGCGYFGVGLLFDAAGDDEYNIHADGQGLGGVAGVGILADRGGDDSYVAERKHSITGRPSYHSPDLDVGVSNVQGCGIGRRGDGSDGHSWAGGLGALLDGGGNDFYSAGNWSMGTGYWFGIGLLHDRAGDDKYNGVCYSQGTGAHFCIGALIDEAGDDQHFAHENSNSSLAWAHDFTIGLLLNIGGDDKYHVDTGGLAYSINRSVAMLIDTGGDDTYEINVAKRGENEHADERPGFAMNAKSFRARSGVGTYFADTTSIGLFLDIGGDDQYTGGEAALPGSVGNNRHWLDPPGSPNWADRNFSVGVDRAAGEVDFTPRPVKVPSGK